MVERATPLSARLDKAGLHDAAITLGYSTLQALGQDSHGLYAWDANDATAVLVDSSVKAKHGGGTLRAFAG